MYTRIVVEITAGVRETGETPVRPRHCKRGGPVQQATAPDRVGRRTGPRMRKSGDRPANIVDSALEGGAQNATVQSRWFALLFFPPAFPPLKSRVRLSILPGRLSPEHRSRSSAVWASRRAPPPQSDGGFSLESSAHAGLPAGGDRAGIRHQDRRPRPMAWWSQLEIAPVVDSVRVAGSAIDVPGREQGGSVEHYSRARRSASATSPMAMDLLRYLPGVQFSQTGAMGGLTGLYISRRKSTISTWWRSMAFRSTVSAALSISRTFPPRPWTTWRWFAARNRPSMALMPSPAWSIT